jgi:hypothetical protein
LQSQNSDKSHQFSSLRQAGDARRGNRVTK